MRCLENIIPLFIFKFKFGEKMSLFRAGNYFESLNRGMSDV
jgi:hypothetical protein